MECASGPPLEVRVSGIPYIEKVSRKGYSGLAGVVDGMAGWEGALLLHTVHLLLVSVMSFDMPGQNIEVWARAVIPLGRRGGR